MQWFVFSFQVYFRTNWFEHSYSQLSGKLLIYYKSIMVMSYCGQNSSFHGSTGVGYHSGSSSGYGSGSMYGLEENLRTFQ